MFEDVGYFPVNSSPLRNPISTWNIKLNKKLLFLIKEIPKLMIMNTHAIKPSKMPTRLFHKPIKKIHALFPYRSNQTKYDLVFLEAQDFQSYYGLIHHVGSPPVIGIQSHGSLVIAGEATGNPTNPAFIPEILLPYGNRMTFYERLQSTLFWLWLRCVKILKTVCHYWPRRIS
jgi:hypothetical protein